MINPEMICKQCGSVLSAVTFTCVRGEYCKSKQQTEKAVTAPERIKVIVRPGKDDWIGVAYSSSAEPNDTIREYRLVKPDDVQVDANDQARERGERMRAIELTESEADALKKILDCVADNALSSLVLTKFETHMLIRISTKMEMSRELNPCKD